MKATEKLNYSIINYSKKVVGETATFYRRKNCPNWLVRLFNDAAKENGQELSSKRRGGFDIGNTRYALNSDCYKNSPFEIIIGVYN